MRMDRAKLYTAIKAHDLQIGKVADQAGISRATLSGILSGRACRENTAQKIADVLGMKLEKLM